MVASQGPRLKKKGAIKETRASSMEMDYEEVIPIVSWGYPEDYHKKVNNKKSSSKKGQHPWLFTSFLSIGI